MSVGEERLMGQEPSIREQLSALKELHEEVRPACLRSGALLHRAVLGGVCRLAPSGAGWCAEGWCAALSGADCVLC